MNIRPVLLALTLSLSLSGCGYNQIQTLDERTEALEANVDTELLRRNDQAITAKVIGADGKETFQAPASAREAPHVDFGRDGN